MPSLGDHIKVLYRAGLLTFCVDMGEVITKVYSIFSYTQSKWMASYITGMARKRATSADPVDKDCIKKAMNSLYSKMLQAKSTQRNMVPYTNARAFVRASGRMNCMNFNIIQFDTEGLGFFGLVETSKKDGGSLKYASGGGFQHP